MGVVFLVGWEEWRCSKRGQGYLLMLVVQVGQCEFVGWASFVCVALSGADRL